ncbi:hypothetical protein I6Z00_002117 [Vibrio parahaemolyticus]|nr:hypothetical protein [Vibrio parahaemolyticus]MDG2639252.1 hypothetical protein [Vibrio parahaemolyticus]
MDIRELLKELRDKIKLVSKELNQAHSEIMSSGDCSGLRLRIENLTIEKKSLRKRIDCLIDDICNDTDHLERKSKAISIIDKANIENANLKSKRKLYSHAHSTCLDASLRETWSANTFPYFQDILAMHEDCSLEAVKSLARQAVYQRALLDSTLRGDTKLLEDYDQEFELISEHDKIVLDELINKVLLKTDRRFKTYEKLMENFIIDKH